MSSINSQTIIAFIAGAALCYLLTKPSENYKDCSSYAVSKCPHNGPDAPCKVTKISKTRMQCQNK